MRNLPVDRDPKLLVGVETSDDAAVYLINEDLALVQTLDFFTPVVDDAYVFGQIAAANSLSDVYAMGGDPLLALNIVCFPEDLPPESIDGILRGGQDKIREAGALLVGGHTVEDKEPKYGLSVTGLVHPKDVKKNSSAKVGDILVLTKPLGIGILNTGIKAQIVSEAGYLAAIETMMQLNDVAKDAMVAAKANACTDITGFGFLGHAYEMAAGSDLTLYIDVKSVPIFPEALELADQGIVPAGTYKNLDHISCHLAGADEISPALLDCLVDPQTSGGLLIAVPEENLPLLIQGLEDNPTGYAIVGRVAEKEKKSIVLI